MQVWIDVKFMHKNFSGCGHSGFGKKLIIWNQLKKFMQVEVNVLCTHTNFDGCRHSGFRDIATFKNDQISLSDHGL